MKKGKKHKLTIAAKEHHIQVRSPATLRLIELVAFLHIEQLVFSATNSSYLCKSILCFSLLVLSAAPACDYPTFMCISDSLNIGALFGCMLLSLLTYCKC